MAEEEKKVFYLKGKMDYEFEIAENQFTYRGQISTENNLVHLIAIRELTENLIKRQKHSDLSKKEKMPKDELMILKSTHRWTKLTSARLAAIIYKNAIDKELAPKIEVVPAMPNLKKV